MNTFNPDMNLNDIVFECWNKGMSPSDAVKLADDHGFITTPDTIISMYGCMSATFNAFNAFNTFLAARADRKKAQLSR